ncbi:AAA family ATPase [Demequina sp. SYSU T00192]|uniref:AAA family ATPase n=1 Tax=Demequina litoralis TaxID=3051660 RepID=A0ABT8G615_9MICO|nr:AAA family ATPase [Demequina sp. SYSU T00192]MDN4474581.1 AAA family ATPase [Demequina sp. SYSU T00192]
MSVLPMAATMVGREADLDALVEALRSGARGEPRAVLVRGEAGIGKTRLLRELAERASSWGDDAPVTALAHCVDLGPVGAPLAPIRRLLRAVRSEVGAEAFAEATAGDPVMRALGTLVPGIATDAGPFEGAPDMLADAVERLIERLSERRHVVLAVEDIHWADEATLGLLRTLATTVHASRLTLVMTFRTDDVDRGATLRDTLAELQRSRAVTTLEMTRLSREAVTAHAGQILERPPTEAEIDTLMRRSEGVPFFVEELLGIAEGELPSTLREVVLARVDRLDAVGSEVVRAAAVGGARVDHDLLAHAWSADPDTLTAGLRAAVSGNVLTVDGDAYVFRHALIREAVYDALMPAERHAIHRRYASALQARVDAGHASAAAPAAVHWLAAGDEGAAFDATVVARSHARTNLTVDAAAGLGERLIALWPRVERPADRAGTDEFALRRAVAAEYRTSHHLRRCLAVLEDALAAAPEGDADVRVPLLLMRVDAERETELRASAGRRLDEIEALLAGREDSASAAWRARALAWRAGLPGTPEAHELLDRAVALATDAGDDPALADVLITRARLGWTSGSLAASSADLDRVLELCPEPDDTRLGAVNNLVCNLLQDGRFEEAIDLGLTTVRQTYEAGRERAGAHILSNTAEGLIAVGRLDEGIDAARRSVRLTRGDSIQVVLNAIQIEALALVWADRRDDYEALMAREAESEAHAALVLQWVAVWHMLLADAAVAAAHDAPAAERARILADALPLLDALDGDEALQSPGDLDVLLVSGAALVEAALRSGVPEAEARVPRLRELTALAAREASYRTVEAMVAAYLAPAHESVALWRTALHVCDAGTAPRRYAHVARYRLGEALLDAGARTDAIAELRTVVERAPADGVMLVERWARELLARIGDGEHTARPAAGLTAREAQVLGLVAEGLTNGQIGERLFISRKTASVHVSAILAKLGATNRAEAAALAATLLAATPLEAPRRPAGN